MKRIAILASLAFLGAACIVRESTDPCQDYGTLTVYWRFVRHTQAGNLSYSCSQAGVQTVELWIGNERVYDGPCADARGVEGITVTGYPDSSTYGATLLAYDSGDRELFEVRHATVYTEECNTVGVPALTGNLDVAPIFDAVTFASPVDTCSGAGIDTIRYALRDSAGVTVSSADVSCRSDSPDFSIANLDLGAYTLQPIAALTASDSTVLLYQACEVAVSHFNAAGDAASPTLVEGQVCP